MSETEDQLKMAAAQSATALVTDGMVVGLGTGSTAAFAVTDLGKRVQQGLRIVGIPTSERTAAQARSLGIPIASLAEHPVVDITIDGADEVEDRNLNLIKGLGGALLREKIVAGASKRLVIIVHKDKLVKRLATTVPLPVEVVPFGWQLTARRLSDFGATPALRLASDGQPFHSDSGNFIVDCRFEREVSAESLAQQLDHIVGLVEHGFFIGLTAEVHVADAAGVRVLRSDNRRS
jgi:ribose 5-phosphate isomerase A